MTRFTEEESVERFGRKLRGMGVESELEKLGAKRGDEVKILDYIFIFKD
jgi:GTP-binding protein